MRKITLFIALSLLVSAILVIGLEGQSASYNTSGSIDSIAFNTTTGSYNLTGLGGEHPAGMGFSEDLATRFGTLEFNNTKGAIPTIKGARPFYTNGSNPVNGTHVSCLDNMSAGDSCEVMWYVNATGDVGSTYVFFSTGFSYNDSGNITDRTRDINVTITSTSLDVWDETDPEGGNIMKFPDDNVSFFANYTHSTQGTIPNGTCVINFSDNHDAEMVWNDTKVIYEYTRTFSDTGTYTYEVSCNKTGYPDQYATGEVSIDGTNFTCVVVEGGCTGDYENYTGVMRMSNYTNAHAELINGTDEDYNWTVCCDDLYDQAELFNHTGETVARLSGTSNAHAEQNDQLSPDYPYEVYLGAYYYAVLVEYNTTSCSDNFTCAFTLSNYTNAHVASCHNDPYDIQVCLGLETPPFLIMDLYDNTDPDGGNITVYRYETAEFYANVTDQQLNPLNATCYIDINDSTNALMDYNDTAGLHTYSKQFPEGGWYMWNVSCNYTGFRNTTESDLIFIDVDESLPVIDILTPLDNDILGWTVLLRANASDYSLDEVWYEIKNGTVDDPTIDSGFMNNITNITFNGTLYTNTTWPYNNTELIGLNITFVVFANDTEANVANASTFWTLDNTKPSIQYLTPTNNGYYTNSNFTLDIFLANTRLNYTNYTIVGVQDNELNLSSATYTWADLVDVDSLSEGNYTVTVFANDTIGSNRTKSSWFYVDKTSPNVTIDNETGWVPPTPANATVTDVVAHTFNLTCNDSFLTNAWINMNGSINYSLATDGANAYWWSINGGLDEGDYEYTGYCNDSAGNIAATETRTFIVDNSAPIVRQVSPANASTHSLGYILMTCNYSDVGGVENISLWTDMNGAWEIVDTANLSGSTSGEYTFTLQDLIDGTHKWACSSEDIYGYNQMSAENWTFTSQVGNLSCGVYENSCPGGYTDFLRMSARSDAHAELVNGSSYDYIVCCDDLNGHFNLSNSSGFNFLDISAPFDAHVELPNENNYVYEAWIGAGDKSVSCEYEETSGTCSSGTCLATVSTGLVGKNTDLHIADCNASNAYDTSICCELTDRPVVTFVNISSDHPYAHRSGNLTGYYEFLGQQVQNETRWYINGTEEISLINASWVPSSYNAYGAVWVHSVRIFDGFFWSEWENSSEFIINSPPNLTAISLNPEEGMNGAQVNVTSVRAVDADDVDQSNLTMLCGSSSGNYNLCNSTGSAELTCSFTSPWSDDSLHPVYCVVKDLSGHTSVERNNQFQADNTPPSSGNVLNVEDDTTSKFWDNDDDNNTIIQLNYGEDDIRCRYSSSNQTYDNMDSDNGCSVVGSLVSCNAWDIMPMQSNDTTTYIACEDKNGNDQPTNSTVAVSYGIDWTVPSVTSNNDGQIHAPGYNVTLTVNDLPIGSVVTVMWCNDTNGTCEPTDTFTGSDGTTYNITFNNRGTWYLRWNATDEAGNVNETKQTIILINNLPTVDAHVYTNYTGHIVRVNVTASDEDSSQDLNCTLYHGVSTWNTTLMSHVSGALYNGTWEANISMADGYLLTDVINVYVNCTDGIEFSTNLPATSTILPNYAPEFNVSTPIPNQTWPEDTNNTAIDLTPFFFDPDGDDINYTASLPSNVTVYIDNVTGAVILEPDHNFNGIDSVEFTATDGYLTSNSSNNITLNITPVNDYPVVDLSSLTYVLLPEDSYNDTINLSDYVSDVEDTDDLLNWSCFTNNSDTAAYADNMTKLLNLSSTNNNTDMFMVNCTVYDTEEGYDSSTFLVQIEGYNDAPVVAGLPNVTIDEDSYNDTINVSDYTIDVDNTLDEINYTVVVNDSNVYVDIDNLSKIMNISATADWNGDSYANVTAYDPLGAQGTYSFMIIIVNPVNDAPIVHEVNITPAFPGSNDDLNCSVLNASDVDGDVLNYTFIWYRNDVMNRTVYTSENYTILGAGNTSKPEVWNCTAVPYDGNVNGTEAGDSVVVGNVAPNPAYGLEPRLFHNQTRYINWTIGTDSDGDNVTSWLCIASNETNRNSGICDVHAYSEENDSYQFMTGELGCTDTFCQYFTRIIDTDQILNSSNYDDYFNVTNSRPNVSDVEIIPDVIVGFRTAECNYTFTDPDSDEEGDSYYNWWIQNESLGAFELVAGENNKTLDNNYYDKDDVIKCCVQAADLYGLNDTDCTNSTTKLVTNDPPVINVSLPNVTFQEDGYNDTAITNLSIYVTDEDTAVEDINWSYSVNDTNVTVYIDNVTKAVNFTALAGWYGTAEAIFYAYDDKGASDFNITFVIVASVADNPNVEDINMTPQRGRNGTSVTMMTVNATDGDLWMGDDNLTLRCGTADFTWNLCNSTSGYPELNCTFDSPWTDNIVHDVFCRVYDSTGTYTPLYMEQFEADNKAPVILVVDNVEGDTTPKYWDTNDNGATLIQIILNETDIDCRWDDVDVEYSSMNVTHECTVNENSSIASCSADSSSEINETSVHVSCRDEFGNEQNTSQNIEVVYGVDWTVPSVIHTNDGSVHPPGYVVDLIVTDVPHGSVVDVWWCNSTTVGCSPSEQFQGTNGTVYPITFNYEGDWYLRWNATDEAGNFNDTKQTIVHIGSQVVNVYGSVFTDFAGHKFSVDADAYDVNNDSLTCVLYHGTGGSYSTKTMDLVSGLDYNGTWQANISTSDGYSVLESVDMYVNCTDGSNVGMNSVSSHSVPNIVAGAALMDLTPDTADTQDDLVCTINMNSTDNDSDNVSYYMRWYNGSTLFMTVQSNYTSVLGAGNTSRGDSWNCTVVPYDGYENGTESSDLVVIGNSAPGQPSVEIVPQYPKDFNDMICNITSESVDPDSDNVNYTFVWYVDDVLNRTIYTNETSDTLGAGNTTDGEFWNCTVVPYDGYENGTAANVQAVVGNNPPTADAGPDQDIAWTAPSVIVTFNGSGSSDPESDPLTYTWDNGLTGEVVNKTYTEAGTYVVVLTVDDGTLSDSDSMVLRIGDNSTIDNESSLVNTTVINSTVLNSTKIRSRIINSSVEDSVNYDSNLTLSTENRSNMNGSYAYNSTIIDSDVVDSSLVNVTVINCTLINVVMENSYCKDSNMTDVTGSGWDVDPSDVSDSSCTGECVIKDSTLGGADLVDTNLTDSVMELRSSDYVAQIENNLFTGQTTSYMVGDDAYHNGVSKSFVDNGDGTVTDEHTELMWQKSDSLSQMNWTDAIAYCNGLSLAGHNDWRLPTAYEIMTMIDYSCAGPSAECTDTYANDAFNWTDADDGRYWSSTTSPIGTNHAYYAYMYGSYVVRSVKNSNHYLRCVREGIEDYLHTGQQISYIGGDDADNDGTKKNLTDNNEETVTDENTGIIWQKSDSLSQMNWTDAIAYCNGLSLAGHNDWRLPTAYEIMTMIDYSCAGPSAECTDTYANDAFNWTDADDGRYWSSTTGLHLTGIAFNLYIDIGEMDPSTKNSEMYVRCVLNISEDHTRNSITESSFVNMTSENCTFTDTRVDDSVCEDSFMTDVTGSGWDVDPSNVTDAVCYGTCVIVDSTINDAVLNNTNVTDSYVEGASTLGLVEMGLVDANITNEELIDGTIRYDGYDYEIGQPGANPLPTPWSLEHIYAQCGDQQCSVGNHSSSCASDNVLPNCQYDCGSCVAPTPSSGGGGGGGSSSAREACRDGIDNDGDGLVDMDDPGCINIFDTDEEHIVCYEDWVCNDWTECSRGRLRTRNCYDLNECYKLYDQNVPFEIISRPRPVEQESCVECVFDSDCEEGFECVDDFCEEITSRCYDGKQNYGETGVDCGGPCDPCTVERVPIVIELNLIQRGIQLIRPYTPSTASVLDYVEIFIRKNYWPTPKKTLGNFGDIIVSPYFNGIVNTGEVIKAKMYLGYKKTDTMLETEYVPRVKGIYYEAYDVSSGMASLIAGFSSEAASSIRFDVVDTWTNFNTFVHETYVPGSKDMVLKEMKFLHNGAKVVLSIGSEMVKVLSSDAYDGMVELSEISTAGLVEGYMPVVEDVNSVYLTMAERVGQGMKSLFAMTVEDLKGVPSEVKNVYESLLEDLKVNWQIVAVVALFGLALFGTGNLAANYRKMEFYKNYTKRVKEKKHQKELERKRKQREIREAKKLEEKKLREELQQHYADLLTEFITKEINQGMTKSKIKKALEEEGWPAKFVSKYVDTYFKANKEFVKRAREVRRIENLEKYEMMEQDIDKELSQTSERIAHHHEKYMTDDEGLKFRETKVHVKKEEPSEKMQKRLEKQISDIDKKLEELNR